MTLPLTAFFAWRVTRDGQLIDAKDVIPAPDAEAYIATALIAAHRKWYVHLEGELHQQVL